MSDCNWQHSRFRNDDGSEATATWMAALDTSIAAVALDTNIRFRTAAYCTAPSVTSAYQLQYNRNAGGWVNVTNASNYVRAQATANLVDGASTTNQIATGYTFLGSNSQVDSGDGATGSVMITSNMMMEMESCFRVRSADVQGGDVIKLRWIHVADSQPLTGATDLQMTVPSAGGSSAFLGDSRGAGNAATLSAGSRPTYGGGSKRPRTWFRRLPWQDLLGLFRPLRLATATRFRICPTS